MERSSAPNTISYRRFSADSTVTFDTDSGDADVTLAEPQPEAAPAPEPVRAIAGNKEVAPRELPEPVPELPQVTVAPLKLDIIPGEQPKIEALPRPHRTRYFAPPPVWFRSA